MFRFRSSPAHALAATAVAIAALHTLPAFAQDKATTLATYGEVKIVNSDYEASILRIPERDRFGWAMSQERVAKEVADLLRNRAIAAEAKRLGLDADPSIKARVELYNERLLVEAYAAKVDVDSAKEFQSKLSSYTERAREQFLVNKSQYQSVPEVRAAHILVRIAGRTPEEALAKTKSLRERIVAGESFEAIAEANSEDPTAKQNKGELGFFGPGQMDPAFETAAMALAKPGDISEPVRTSFGYHLIKLEEKKPARQMTFEEVAPDLLEKLKAQFMEIRRTQEVARFFDPGRIQWNEPAVAALKKTVPAALLKP